MINIDWTFFSLSKISTSAVYCSIRQAVVHARDVLLRGLLHHPSVLRVHLHGQNVDRSEVPPSLETHDCSWHPPISQRSQDLQLNPIGSAYLHLHLRLAHGGWNHTSGKWKSYIIKQNIPTNYQPAYTYTLFSTNRLYLILTFFIRHKILFSGSPSPF